MRSLCVLALLAITSATYARPLPDLVCRETRLVFVDPISLAVQEYESRTIYRFKSGSLYILTTDRTEYLYNKVIEVEPMRYTSGHKVIQFEGNGIEFHTAILVHTYRDEVRVSRAKCKQQ
jgi:hypothetical protein